MKSVVRTFTHKFEKKRYLGRYLPRHLAIGVAINGFLSQVKTNPLGHFHIKSKKEVSAYM